MSSPPEATPEATPITDDTLFGRIVYALVMDESRPATVEAMAHEAVVLRFPRTKTRALLLRYLPDRDPAMVERLRTGIRQLASAPVDVVLIGGPPSAHELLARSWPRFTVQAVSLHHLSDDGTLWQRRVLLQRKTPLARHLGPPQGPWPPSREDSDRFAERVRAQLAAVAGEHEERGTFAAALRRRRPVATWTLAAILLAVSGLQFLWGAFDTTPALVRMGAFVPERIHAGEWWRFVSAAFLHTDVAHVTVNMIVLLMLGGFLERLLGTSRFLVLYGASALAGGLASLLASKASISVGASGALWGLLAAEAVLVFRPRGLLPAALLKQARGAIIFNLILNLSISLHPRIAFAAHLGGGIMGALLIGTGLLTVGVRPILGVAVDTSSGNGRQPAPRGRLAFAAGAAAVVIALAAGLVLALASGRPWTLDAAPELARRPLPDLGITAELPSSLAPSPVEPIEDGVITAFGDALIDPVRVEISRIPLDAPVPAEKLAIELERRAESLAGLIARVKKAPEYFQAGERRAVRARYELFFSDALLQRAEVIVTDAPASPAVVIRVDVFTWPHYGAAYDDLGQRILASLAPLAQP